MTPRSRTQRAARATLLWALAAGCSAVGPDYAAPQATLPESWREDAEGLSRTEAQLEGWWRSFGDPLLDDLVERSTAGSLDVREALLRVEEARALAGVARADRVPTVDLAAGYRRSGESENTPFGPFAPDSDDFALGFDAAWELDLFGRVRRSIEAAEAEFEASLEDARDAAVTVSAETADAYVQLRAFRSRITLARTNVALQEQTLELVQARFDAGMVGESDLAQARTNLETTRSSVPSLEIGARASENRLAVLLGLTPGALAEELAAEAPIPVPPATVAVGVPADLLRRRADVRRAERELAAETARLGETEARLYPSLSLNGNLGVASEELSDLSDGDSNRFGYGPSLRWNLFDGGRLRGRVEAQDARMQQARVRWERAVLLALEEAENAMLSFLREQVRRTSLSTAVEQARVAVDRARTQYTEGLADFQTVLVSERALAQLEDELAQNGAAITGSAVALYKALGGGWETAPLAAAAE